MPTLKKTSPCCQTGCPDCPYDYGKSLHPDIPREWQESPLWNIEVYDGELPEDEKEEEESEAEKEGLERGKGVDIKWSTK